MSIPVELTRIATGNFLLISHPFGDKVFTLNRAGYFGKSAEKTKHVCQA